MEIPEQDFRPNLGQKNAEFGKENFLTIEMANEKFSHLNTEIVSMHRDKVHIRQEFNEKIDSLRQLIKQLEMKLQEKL